MNRLNGSCTLIFKQFVVFLVNPCPSKNVRSIDYEDLDANRMEFQIELMDLKTASDFMTSQMVAANPIGEPFAPEKLVARFESGEPVEDLSLRSDQPKSAGASFTR